MVSNFEKVLEFNKAFGVNTNESPKLDIFKKDPKLVKYRMDLIMEEVDELKTAVENGDFIETVDALSDILYVVYGKFTALGVDADLAFDIVHESNMSKLCKTEKDAQDTVESYYNQIPRVYDSPTYKKANDNVHWVVYNKSSGKILKNHKYKPADFSAII